MFSLSSECRRLLPALSCFCLFVSKDTVQSQLSGFPLRIQSYTFNTLFAIISGHHDLGHLSKSVGDKSDGTTISNNDEELGLEAGGTPNKSHVKANPVLK